MINNLTISVVSLPADIVGKEMEWTSQRSEKERQEHRTVLL